MNIGIFGATGLIGREFISILNENKVNIDPFLFASSKSVGKKIFVNQKYVIVNKITEESFKNLDYAFFFVPSSVVSELKKYAKKYNVKVIDNSSYCRMSNEVPLIIDEINGYQAFDHDYISNPNCTTIQAVLPLYYLDKQYSLKSVDYVTYQSLSGGGNRLLKEFEKNRFFESVYPFIGNNDNFYTEEEIKMIKETKKILSKDIKIRALCVRIPSIFCHGCFVDAIFDKNIDIDKCKKVLNQKRIHVCTSINSQRGRNDILVTRLRQDIYDKNRLQFFCIADNLRVGASYNSFLIGKRLNLF